VDVSCVCSFLCITRPVSLVYVPFMRNALRCHSERVWYRWPVVIWWLALIVYYITVNTVCLCHKGKILLIAWFLSTFVHLLLSVLVGMCLVKNSSGVPCSSEAGSTA
jgi:hypothetical protein